MTGDLGKSWKLWYVNTGRHSQGPSPFGQLNLSFEEVASLWTQPHPFFRGVVLSISRERFHRKTGNIHKHLEHRHRKALLSIAIGSAIPDWVHWPWLSCNSKAKKAPKPIFSSSMPRFRFQLVAV
jgi:hypothetical protein